MAHRFPCPLNQKLVKIGKKSLKSLKFRSKSKPNIPDTIIYKAEIEVLIRERRTRW